MVAAAGSFAAVSTLFGSPLLGAFLLMEGPDWAGSLELVLLPGLLAAGIGSLVFIGLAHWTGLGTFSLRIGNLPHVGSPRAASSAGPSSSGWPPRCSAPPSGGSRSASGPSSRRNRLLVTPAAGLIGRAGHRLRRRAPATRRPTSCSPGRSALPHLVGHAAGFSVGALLLLLACKGLAYGVSLSGFRGGPVFPSLFIGAAGGIPMSHLPGLGMIAGMAMGIGAMCAVMLRLPLTSVLLATLLLYSDGVVVMPLVIVAVVVAYVVSARLRAARTGAGAGGPHGRGGPAGHPLRMTSAVTRRAS